MANSEGEDVDDLIGVQSEEMRTEDALGAVLDKRLESGVSGRDAPRRVPT